ncbi:Alpha-ionylideneethane synthase abl3 [Alternaria hordeiaustralica]|uniref:Alpha-ionylideneethane synthase abl3 n=1 Tax=Alternaria hordeiaustralica TaxID=1187925 RepID=UPI0020C5684B|nr:Alpha-ionylideneethane synthase abl3 [Alternaria hordeiaustralica]KAI4691929.1 Alpha-ionylideneethane synthase abl3 [Alternaria hordeiaustralica]
MLYAYFEGLCKQYRETLSGFKLTRPFFKPSLAVPNEQSVPPIREKWYYPADIANDLKDVDLPQRIKEEVYACAWEYARCVIPQYTNWNRYVAFMRVIVIGIVAECKGDLVQVSLDDNLLGYNLTALLDELFQGTTEQ